MTCPAGIMIIISDIHTHNLYFITYVAALVTRTRVIASAGTGVMMVKLVAVAIVVVVIIRIAATVTVIMVMVVVLIASIIWPIVSLRTRIHVIARIAVVVVAATAAHCATSTWYVTAASTHLAATKKDLIKT